MSEMILTGDDRAATFKTNISGWVSRHGRYFGDDERTARYDGATHSLCSGCGKQIEKARTICHDCAHLNNVLKYGKMEKIKWDKKTPLYSRAADEYFFGEDELSDFLEESEEWKLDSLMLVICRANEFRQIDEDFFCDELPEDSDGDIPDTVFTAMDAFNKAMVSAGAASWSPSKYRAII